jgi:hypothetical protein
MGDLILFPLAMLRRVAPSAPSAPVMAYSLDEVWRAIRAAAPFPSTNPL